MGRAKLPGIETLKGLVPVLRFAKPHWAGIALSVLLMAVQATASTGRLVLFYPILTRVLLPQSIAAGTNQAGEEAAVAVETVKKRTGGFAGTLERFTDATNAVTGKLVPEAWLEDAAGPDATPEQRARAVAVRRDQFATLITVLLLFLIFIVVMCVASYGESYVAEKVRLSILMDVREALCTKLLDQPVGFYDSRQRGELVQRVLGDVEGYAAALRLMLDGVVRGLMNVLATVVFLLLLSWQLTLICLLGLPFLLPMKNLLKKTLKRAHRRQQQSARRVEMLLQIFSGIRTVKAFGTETRRVQDFRAVDELVTSKALKVQRTRSAADALTAFINNFLAMILAVGGGFLVLRGLLPVHPGELVMFLVLVGNLYQPLKRVVKQLTHLQDRMASVERTTEYLDTPAGKPRCTGCHSLPGDPRPHRVRRRLVLLRTGEPGA